MPVKKSVASPVPAAESKAKPASARRSVMARVGIRPSRSESDPDTKRPAVLAIDITDTAIAAAAVETPTWLRAMLAMLESSISPIVVDMMKRIASGTNVGDFSMPSQLRSTAEADVRRPGAAKADAKLSGHLAVTSAAATMITPDTSPKTMNVSSMPTEAMSAPAASGSTAAPMPRQAVTAPPAKPRRSGKNFTAVLMVQPFTSPVPAPTSRP